MAYWSHQPRPAGHDRFVGQLRDLAANVLRWALIPDRKVNATDTDYHLMRLAETSPHLLIDLGFRPGPGGVWSNGRMRVGFGATPQAERNIRAGRT